MAVARFPSVVLDCPDPGALARFYGSLLDWESRIEPDWAEVRADYGQCLCFQKVEDYRPPAWPTQDVPQQLHLDLVVDDLDSAQVAVEQLGGSTTDHQPGTTFRVFLDPAGHPFCCCTS